METTPTPTEAPAPPENVTPINGSEPSEGAPEPFIPTEEDIAAAKQAIRDDMREAIPFNRDAIHTGFQRAIQESVVGPAPGKAGDPNKTTKLCSAFRDWAEAESFLREA